MRQLRQYEENKMTCPRCGSNDPAERYMIWLFGHDLDGEKCDHEWHLLTKSKDADILSNTKKEE